MNYYERHIGDYLKDTAHLTLLEHGIYCRLLDVYYTRESAIPVEQVQRLIGAKSKEEKFSLDVVLKEFFRSVDGFYIQDRCERVIAEHVEFIEKQRAAGKASAVKRANGGSTTVQPPFNGRSTRDPSPVGVVVQPPTPTPTPTQIPVGEAEPPDADKALWDLGIGILGESNRSMLGKLVKDHGRKEVAAKVGELAAMSPRPVDPKAWLIACLRPREDKPTRFKTA